MRDWIANFCRVLMEETRDPGELIAGWLYFQRGYGKPFWPTPGMICGAIQELRVMDHQYATPVAAIAPPDYHKPELVSWETRQRTLAAIEQAKFIDDPALAKMLVKLGQTVIERNGPPNEQIVF